MSAYFRDTSTTCQGDCTKRGRRHATGENRHRAQAMAAPVVLPARRRPLAQRCSAHSGAEDQLRLLRDTATARAEQQIRRPEDLRANVYETALHCTALHCTAPHCTAPHCTAPHRTPPHFATLHCTALCQNALHCTALHCTALHCTALHCTALPCTALHCTAPPCTALHCTAPPCTALHRPALHSTVLCAAVHC